VRTQFVALPFRYDHIDFCTSVFGTTIGDLISSQMEAFYLQQLWSNTLAANTIVPCITDNVPIPLDNSSQFNLESLRGIFFFYFGGMGVLLTLHLIGVCYSSVKTRYKLKAKAKAQQELEKKEAAAAEQEQSAITGDEESGIAKALAAAAYEEEAEYFDNLDHKLNRAPVREAMPYTGVPAEEDEPWVIAAREREAAKEREALKLEGPPVVGLLCGVEEDAFLDTLMFPISGLMGGTQRGSATPAEVEMQQRREREQALANRKRMLNAVVDEAESNASSNDAFNAFADFDSDSDAEGDGGGGGVQGWLTSLTNVAAAAARPQIPKNASAEDKENAIMSRALRRILKYMEEPPTKEMLERSQSQINDVLALLIRNKNKKDIAEVKRRNTIFSPSSSSPSPPPPPPPTSSSSSLSSTSAAAATVADGAKASASVTSTSPAPSPQRIRLGAPANPSTILQKGPNQNVLVNRVKAGLKKDISSTDEEEEDVFYG